jgi:hypothetical protein
VTDTPYVEVAAADGAWTAALRLPDAVPLERVRHALTDVTRTTGWPAAAFVSGRAAAVTDMLLYRDPSRTHGTPGIAACHAAVRALSTATGWRVLGNPSPGGTEVLVGLGLREGYGPDAREHLPEEAAAFLRAHNTTGWRCHAARLVSARLTQGQVRWYEETGVVVKAQERMLPAITAAAGAFVQHRFTVTHFPRQRTYALQRQTG